MAANNSTLQIEVVSVGIKDTVNRLDSLGFAAARNEAKVKLLTDSLGKLMVAQTSAVNSAAQHSALMSAMAQQMGLMASAASTTAKQVTKLNEELGKLNNTSAATTKASGDTTNAFQRKSNAGGVVNATIRAMTTAALAYLGLNFAKGIVEAADGWVMMQAKLKLATGSMVEAKQVQADLFDMAQRLRVPLDDAAKLYTRMAVPMARMGQTAQQTANQVEYVSLALKLNGATAGEASSVMLQYSQSVNAGRLNGAEFNAVAEGAPLILRAIEAELKATTEWTERSGKSLKKMGADGEISFDLMNRAAQRALPEMRKAFLELPLTVDGAIQRVKNAWYKAMGEMGEDTQMNKKLAAAIGQLEQDIPKIRDALASVFLFLYDNFSRIAAIVQGIVLGKFIQWIAGAALALPALYTGLVAAATGMGAAATGLALLRVGLTALTGPIGIIIALVGLDLVNVWKYFSKEAPKAEDAVTSSTKINTVNRTLMIQKEIDKIVERNNALIKGRGLSLTPDASTPQDILKIEQSIYAATAKQKFMTDKGQIRINEQVIAAAKEHLAIKKAEIPVLAALNKVNADADNAEKLAGVRLAMKIKVETKPEQATREIAAKAEEIRKLGGIMTDTEKAAMRLDIVGKGDSATKRDPYKELRASLKATRLELELNIFAGEKASAAEKLRKSMDAGHNVDYRDLKGTQKANVDADVEKIRELEKLIDVRDRSAKATIDAAAEADKFDKKLKAGVTTINDEIVNTKLKIAALTENKMAVKELAAAEIEAEAQAAEKEGRRELERNYNVERYEAYMAQAAGLRELARLQVELGKGQDEKAATDELNKLLDPKKAMNFGNALKEAFGEAGGAIGEMSKALGIFSKEQDDISASRKTLSGLTDEKKRTAGLQVLDKKEEQSKLRMYGAMASGAKGFFSEHTTAHKLLVGAEKAIRIAEMAGTMADFAMRSGLLTAFTGLFIGAKTTQVAFDATSEAAMLGVHANAALADIGITTSTEATKNAAKVPGVMMSFMSWLGPWGMAAAGVAIAAVMGGAFGGGGGGAAFDLGKHQARQGTGASYDKDGNVIVGSGAVLGDDEAKSASIANAMSALEDNSNIGLVLTSNMLSALRGIEASMQGLAAAIFKVSGMTTGKNFGITEGISGGGFGSSIFGGKTTTTISDTGLSLNGTASDFSSGSGVQQYVDVNKQKSGGWFSKDKSWNERSSMAASDEITRTIGNVFEEINNTIYNAAVDLGANAGSVDAAMKAFIIRTEVSFKGLKGDELAQALNDVFSASADGIARSVFPGLSAFQRAGEGYYQTLIRVSTGTEQAENALKSFGILMVGKESLVNKTGDIAAELVRQSIMAANAGTMLADIMRVMGGSMSELVEGYKSLLDIQDTMRGANLGRDVSTNTIRGAGGIPELQNALGDFVDGFYSDAEKQVVSFSKLRAEFGRLNTTMPQTKAGFKELVTSLMSGDAASQELAGRVLLLGGAFADAFVEAEDARKDAVDKATDKLSDAYDKESDALQNTLDKMKDFTKSLTDFQNSLATGELSTLSDFEKYSAAKLRYDDVAKNAATGNVESIAEFEKAATDFLKTSRSVNASGVNYTADFERVMRETEALHVYTGSQVDVATASLDALKEQVKGLLDIKESVMTVTAAIEALHLAMAAVNPGMAVDGSHANGLSNVPFDGYVAELHKDERVLTASENREYSFGGNTASMSDSALAEEVKALRNELRMLREDQREQTANIIGAQYDSTERNAQKVVSGNKGAMEDASYLQRTKTGLV